MGNNQSQVVNQCDAECQRQKRINQLRNSYKTAVSDETKDNEDVRNTRKQYYTYAYGEAYYNDMESKTLAKVADANIKKLVKRYNQLLDDIKQQKTIKHNNNIAIKNMIELLNNYRTSNEKIFSELDGQEDILETSRREVWYTDQKMDKLNYYGNFINTILKLLIIVAIIFFLYDKKYSSLAIVIICYLLIKHLL